MASLTSYKPAITTGIQLRNAPSKTFVGQGFQIPATALVDSVTVKLEQNGSIGAGDVWAKILDDAAGPNNIVGAISSKTTASTIAGSYTEYTFTFAVPIALSATTQYYLVLEGDYAIGGNYLRWGGNNAAGYPDGTAWYASGVPVWTQVPGNDLYFEVFGESYTTFNANEYRGTASIVYQKFSGNEYRGTAHIYNDFTGNEYRGLANILLNFSGNEYRGCARIANNSKILWELYFGTGADPDPDAAPDETTTSLPFTTTTTFGDSLNHRILVRKRNEYNQISKNVFDPDEDHSYEFTTDGAGEIEAIKPSNAIQISVVPAAGGTVIVKAQYFYLEDGTNAASQFLVYITSNGVDPVPGVDSPTAVDMRKVDGNAKLNWTSGAFADGLTIKVIVQTRRIDAGPVNVDSDDLTVYSTISDTDGPTGQGGSAFVTSKKQTQ